MGTLQNDIELVKSMYEKVKKDNDEADKKDREKKEEEHKFYEEIMKEWREEK